MNKRGASKKRIDVFWKPDQAHSFDLTMSLVTTLTDGLVFGGATVTVKALAPDHNAMLHLENYLSDYCKRSRLHVDVMVSDTDFRQKKVGHLNFVGLEPLAENPSEEEKECYRNYLKEQFHTFDFGEAVAFVTSYDRVDHRAIYSDQTKPENTP